MARKIQNVIQLEQMKNETSVENLIIDYGTKKAELDELKKYCDAANKDIKNFMRNGEHEIEAGNFIAKFSIQDRSTMNEERLLQFLHDNFSKKLLKDSGIIKTKEYIDETALSDAIYNNMIPQHILADMESCKDYKTVEVLKITEKKEKK